MLVVGLSLEEIKQSAYKRFSEAWVPDGNTKGIIIDVPYQAARIDIESLNQQPNLNIKAPVLDTVRNDI